VNFSFPLEEVLEGRVRLLVPQLVRGKGPGSKGKFPFYNPVMVLNRDISLLILQDLVSLDGKKILDGLAATGVRGIRFCKEVEGDFFVTINDWNPDAFNLIMKNMERNGLDNAEARKEDLNLILSTERFDYIDIDPFGSPVPFLESALHSITKNGIIGVTATDTACLCGSYPRTCLERYGALPLKTEYCHEVGLRILIGYIARMAARHGMGVMPLFCFSIDHYFRLHLKLILDKEKAYESLINIGYVAHNMETGEREICNEPEQGWRKAGPLWTGEIINPEFAARIRERSYMDHRTSKFLEICKEEAGSPPFFYTTNELSKYLRIPPPRIREIIECLKDIGYKATRTHFNPCAFKTNADFLAIKKAFQEVR